MAGKPTREDDPAERLARHLREDRARRFTGEASVVSGGHSCHLGTDTTSIPPGFSSDTNVEVGVGEPEPGYWDTSGFSAGGTDLVIPQSGIYLGEKWATWTGAGTTDRRTYITDNYGTPPLAYLLQQDPCGGSPFEQYMWEVFYLNAGAGNLRAAHGEVSARNVAIRVKLTLLCATTLSAPIGGG